MRTPLTPLMRTLLMRTPLMRTLLLDLDVFKLLEPKENLLNIHKLKFAAFGHLKGK